MTLVPDHADRDFVASAWIVRNGKILLIHHRKSGLWLPPGGHIDPGETPHETAVREALEETGIHVNLLDSAENVGESYNLPHPFRINLHPVTDDHWHCGFGYLAEVEKEGEATHAHEHNGMNWFSIDELQTTDKNLPEAVQNAAIRAITLAGRRDQ